MAAKGFEKTASPTPDLLVHYHASFTQQVDVNGIDRGDQLKKWVRPNGAPDISPFPRPLEVDGLTNYWEFMRSSRPSGREFIPQFLEFARRPVAGP